MERCTLEVELDGGEGHLTVDRKHPLVTAFRRSVDEGTRTGTWLYLVAASSASRVPKLLGTVAWTVAGRLLFFPGNPGRVLSTHPDGSLNGCPIDHVTLEFDDTGRSFDEHVAVFRRRRKSRGQGRRGRVHENTLHPWFSVLVNDLDGFQAIPASYSYSFEVPTPDVARRSRAMMGRGLLGRMSFPEPTVSTRAYFQIDVWAGRGAGWEHHYAGALPWATHPDLLQGHLGETLTAARVVQRLGPDIGVVVVLTRPSGCVVKPGLLHAAIEPGAATSGPADL